MTYRKKLIEVALPLLHAPAVIFASVEDGDAARRLVYLWCSFQKKSDFTVTSVNHIVAKLLSRAEVP